MGSQEQELFSQVTWIQPISCTHLMTIINGDVFKKIAHLEKKAFKAADKTPVGYDNQPFKLDCHLDFRMTFGDRTLHTTVYLKMDAQDPQLSSEGARHQLGIISYHPVFGVHPLQYSVTAVPVVRVKLYSCCSFKAR